MDQLRAAVTRRLRSPRLRGPAAKAGALGLLVLAGSIAAFAAGAASRTAGPLANTYASPEALAQAVIDAIHAGDRNRLQALALTEEEFRMHVWPHLPASRPERNVPFAFAWGMLRQNSAAHLHQTLDAFRHASLQLRRVETTGATSAYGGVAVHRDATIIVAGADGEERIVRLFGSMVKRNGRWKVFSYVVND